MHFLFSYTTTQKSSKEEQLYTQDLAILNMIFCLAPRLLVGFQKI